MGSGAPVQKFGSQELIMDPALKAQIGTLSQQLQGSTAAYGQQAQNAAGGFKTDFSGFAGGAAPQLDAFSKNLVSQQQQVAQGQLAGQQQQIAQKFGATQPGVADILKQQAAMQSQLQLNPLQFQAAAAQNDRQMAAQQQGNAALAQRLQMQSLPMQQQQTLLQTLSALAALTGTQKSYETPGGTNQQLTIGR